MKETHKTNKKPKVFIKNIKKKELINLILLKKLKPLLTHHTNIFFIFLR